MAEPSALDRSRWHRLGEKEMFRAVAGICDWLWDDQAALRNRMLNQLRWYEGVSIPSLDASAYLQRGQLRTGPEGQPVHWNTPRALVSSVVAKIAGRQRPKPSIVCTDADWATKRRAKRLERFAEATLHQPQGNYRDSWELATRVFLDCCVFGLGAIHVFADLVGERIAAERVLPWELLVDPLEATNGQPLNKFHRYRYDKDRLIAEFPQARDAIHTAKDDEPKQWGRGLRIARACTVYEAWRLPLGPKDKGRHSICIDKKTLHSEEWTRDEFPFEIIRWSPHLLGYGATSLIEEAEPTADEMNFAVERAREGERKLAAGYLVYEENSVPDEVLKDTKIGMLVPVKPGATKLPEVIQPNGYSESTLQWMKLHYEKSFELTGVSQMGATSRKEPGLTAAVALRAVASMETERFSLAYTAFEQAVAVGLTRHNIACAREVAAATKNFRMRWPGAGFMREVSWEDADLEDKKYVLQGEAVAGIANTPADRLQLGQDLFNSGIISADSFVRIIQLGKDVEAELRGRSIQREVLERFIEKTLDATPEDEEEGRYEFRGPLPFMKLGDAILQIGDAYMQAELDGAPAWNLTQFTTFIDIASDMLAKQMPAPPGVPAAPELGARAGLDAGAPLAPAGGQPARMVN